MKRGGTGRRKGKTKNEMHKMAAGMTKNTKKGSRGIDLTFNKTHRVPGNAGGRKAFSARRRAHRG